MQEWANRYPGQPYPRTALLANGLICPGGPAPSRGYILMLRRDIDNLNKNAAQSLYVNDGNGNWITFQGLYWINGRNISPGSTNDPTAVYLCEIADSRWLCQNPTYKVPINAQYNVRAPGYGGAYYQGTMQYVGTLSGVLATGSSVVTGISSTASLTAGMTVSLAKDPGPSDANMPPANTIASVDSGSQITLTYPVTTTGTTTLYFYKAWTWSTMAGDIWALMTGALGTFPGLPITPDGAPEDWKFPGCGAWQALNQVLYRCGCMIAPDLRQTIGSQYSIVQIGATDATTEAIITNLEKANAKVFDEEWIESDIGRLPYGCNVFFHIKHQDFGTEETTAQSANQWSVPAVLSVQLVGQNPSTTYSGLYHPIWDDLPALYNPAANPVAVSATVAAGGTGYVVGNTLTVSGGTALTAAQFNVAAVSSTGAVLGVTLQTPGEYTAVPSNPASTTGGAGSGCTLTVSYATVTNATALTSRAQDRVNAFFKMLSSTGGSRLRKYYNRLIGFTPGSEIKGVAWRQWTEKDGGWITDVIRHPWKFLKEIDDRGEWTNEDMGSLAIQAPDFGPGYPNYPRDWQKIRISSEVPDQHGYYTGYVQRYDPQNDVLADREPCLVAGTNAVQLAFNRVYPGKLNGFVATASSSPPTRYGLPIYQISECDVSVCDFLSTIPDPATGLYDGIVQQYTASTQAWTNIRRIWLRDANQLSLTDSVSSAAQTRVLGSVQDSYNGRPVYAFTGSPFGVGSGISWFVVNGVSASNSNYYDATLLGFVPGSTPTYPPLGTKVWLVSPQGFSLVTNHKLPANNSGKSGSAQPTGGGSSESRPIWQAFFDGQDGGFMACNASGTTSATMVVRYGLIQSGMTP